MWRNWKNDISFFGSYVHNCSHQPYHAFLLKFVRFLRAWIHLWIRSIEEEICYWIICSSKIPSNLPSWFEQKVAMNGAGGYLNSFQNMELRSYPPGYLAHLSFNHWNLKQVALPHRISWILPGICCFQGWGEGQLGRIGSCFFQKAGDKFQLFVCEFSVWNLFGDGTREPSLTYFFWGWTQLKLHSLQLKPLKINGWKMILSFWGGYLE